MKSLILVFLFLFGGILFKIQAQENTKLDSLLAIYDVQKPGVEKIKTAQELFQQYKNGNLHKAFDYAIQAIAYSDKINYRDGKGIGFLNLAYYYQLKPNIDSTRHYLKKSISILSDLPTSKNLWEAKHQFSVFETKQGNFDTALKLSDECKNLAVELNDGDKLTKSLRRKSTIYIDTGNYDRAMEEIVMASRIADTISPENKEVRGMLIIDASRIEMLRGNYQKALDPIKNAIKLFTEDKNHFWLSISLTEIGNLYWYMEKFDGAISSYQKSIEVAKNIGRKDLILSNMANIGLVYSSLGNYDKALEYQLNFQKLIKESGVKLNETIGLNNIGTTYRKKKKFKKAIEYHGQAIQLADSINALDVMRDGYWGRSMSFRDNGNYRKALEDYIQYQIINDSVFNLAKSEQIEKLKTIYNTEKKEQEIALLEQNAEISNLQKLLLGLGLGLSFLTFGIGFYALLQKMKGNKLEKEQVDAELAFKKKELTTHALHLAKKNETLESLRQKAEALKSNENGQNITQLINTINFDLKDDNNWENFARYFEEVHKDFNTNATKTYPEITPSELRLMALIKMNLSSKEIANILNISIPGVKKARQRLRKKMDLSTTDSLENAVLSI
ncbi:MAG: tetratricopeptide repeat protein [Flavobacteriaceae bacterium]